MRLGQLVGSLRVNGRLFMCCLNERAPRVGGMRWFSECDCVHRSAICTLLPELR